MIEKIQFISTEHFELNQVIRPGKYWVKLLDLDPRISMVNFKEEVIQVRIEFFKK